MDTIKNFNQPQKSVVWHFQWVKKGSEPSLEINPGEISGFEKFFHNAPKTLSSFYLAVSGTQRFETADWLHQQAVKQGFEQYVTEFQVLLNHSYKDRINNVNEEG